jgi:hypothetical protein
MRGCSAVVVVSLTLAISHAARAQTTNGASTLRAGAAKVDITPAASERPKNNLGVLDRLYARAMVLDNGVTSAALITVDAGAIPDPLWQAVSTQIEKELGISPTRVLLTATHTHSAGGRGANYSQKIVEAVRLAEQKLTLARIGYGTGVSYVNVNRQIVDPKTGRWWEGANYDGPSDTGGEGLNRNDPTVARLMNQQRQMVSSMGQFLGEEVMRVMRGIERTATAVPLYGSFTSIRCPGRERTNEGRAGFEGAYKDAAPVEIRLGLLRVGDVMIGAVNAEVFNPVAQRLKRESPHKATMMATLTNGAARSGYIPDDESFGKYTFEVLSSRLQPGCAESAIVNGILTLIDGARAAQ